MPVYWDGLRQRVGTRQRQVVLAEAERRDRLSSRDWRASGPGALWTNLNTVSGGFSLSARRKPLAPPSPIPQPSKLCRGAWQSDTCRTMRPMS